MHDHAQSLLVHFRRAEEIKAASLAYPSHTLRPDQHLFLELLLTRALYPLTGYLGRADFESVLSGMRLADGRLMPWPVSLDVPAGLGQKLAAGDCLALRDTEGFMLAVLTVSETWPAAPVAEAAALFGVADPATHPGAAAYVAEAGAVRVAGEVVGLALPPHADFQDLRLTPAQIQTLFQHRGWRSVLACPTTGIPHLADKAAIQRAAKNIGARALLVRPVGEAMAGGAAHFAGVRCTGHFAASFPKATAQLVLLPLPQPGAGPRQALFEAVIHGNLGASHTLVARDQNDPRDATGEPLYPLGAAQALVAAHEAETAVTMVAAEPMVYVEEKAQYEPESSVLPEETVRRLEAGEFSRRLEFDLAVPDWFALPEIVAELRSVFPPRSKQGFTLFMTGLSGAGKSTLAKILYVMFMERRVRPVTLLDGDIVRRHLSSELTFSREHRNLNIARIGYVASEITKNGGIAICAPIAPYASARRVARELVSPHGGFVEIHVSTPIAICEQRDRKGLYAKARAGLIKDVTGIDDPYEVPEHAELVLDTTALSPGEAAQEVLLYLEAQGYMG